MVYMYQIVMSFPVDHADLFFIRHTSVTVLDLSSGCEYCYFFFIYTANSMYIFDGLWSFENM